MKSRTIIAEFKVKVLHLDLCEGSDDPDIVARVDVEVTNDTSFLGINGIDLMYNEANGTYSIVEPKTPYGAGLNGLTRRAVLNAAVARYEQIIGKNPKHVWTEFVSDELKDKLFKLKSDNGIVPLGTVDEIVQLFVNDIEKIGNALENTQNKMIWHPYKDCGDAPKVAEYQKDVFLCKVQMYHSDNDEPVGEPVYKVLLCDDNGIFYGYRKNYGDYYNKVIAWTEILG